MIRMYGMTMSDMSRLVMWKQCEDLLNKCKAYGLS